MKETVPIKAVVEDWDDFKVVTQEIKIAHHIEAASRFGKVLTEEEVREHWGIGLRLELGHYYGHHDPENMTDEEFAPYLQAFNDLNESYPKILQDGAIEVHEQFLASGILLGMVTSHMTENVIGEMDMVGIDPKDYLFILGSDKTPATKPDPAAFDIAIDVLDANSVRPEEAVYGGDTLGDAQSSTKAGLQFLGVASGRVSLKEFHDNGFDAVPDIREFGRIVLSKTAVLG